MLDTVRLGMPRREVDRGRGWPGHARGVERHGAALLRRDGGRSRAPALIGTYPGSLYSTRWMSVKSGQAQRTWAYGRVHPPSGPHPCYGPDNAAHTKGVVSPEKKLPLWEIKLVNMMMGIPSGLWSTTTASNTCLPANITPG